MKRFLDPRVLLGAIALVIVALLALRDAADPGPGPLHPSHAGVAALQGHGGCDACHGAARSAASMAGACGACHDAIAAQFDGHTGFHGGLDVEAAACAQCHGEHHGEALDLAGDTAFRRAGFAARDAYDHAGLAFGLTGAHASLACDACHRNADAPHLAAGERRFLGLEQRCTACHDDPHGGRMTRGCAECHGQSEPFETVALFEHTAEFPLDGPHGGLACAECHAQGTRYAVEALGGASPPVARECADCHQAGHSAGFLARVDAGCADCHGGGARSFGAADLEVTAALHGASGFPLADAHATVDCAACHGAEGPFEERFPGRAASDCAVCHDDPHGGQFAAIEAVAGAPARAATACADCHDATSFASSRFGASEHARAGFPLDGAHAPLACDACHVAPDADAPRVFRGTMSHCSACHDDVHGGAFAERGLALAEHGATDCAACHGTAAFAPARAFDHGEATGFALAGAHAAADCSACHGPPADAVRAFGRVEDHVTGFAAGEPARCVTCHEDPHGDRFAALGAGGARDCASCHTETSFLDVAPGAFDHAGATGFALEGAHAQTRCVKCHVPAKDAPRRLGDVAAAFPGPTGECATCHADPHGGRFEGVDAPARFEERSGCARCHTPESFRGSEGFDHGAWTGFALSGAHAEADCTACHAPKLRDALGRTTAPAEGTSCADCHADPHLGQFDLSVGDGCVRCHDSTEAFTAGAFDHADARFALDAKHDALDCGACHVPSRTRDGREAVRYRPLGRECADCHDPGTGGGR